jgi:hypothetical protein
VYICENKHLRFDTTASILLQALHLMAWRLNCSVSIEHLPQLSSPAVVLADYLSQASTTSSADMAVL